VYLTSPSIGSLANKSTVFTGTPIASGTGTIYVPSDLVATY
jgi:ribosomal protein L24E